MRFSAGAFRARRGPSTSPHATDGINFHLLQYVPSYRNNNNNTTWTHAVDDNPRDGGTNTRSVTYKIDNYSNNPETENFFFFLFFFLPPGTTRRRGRFLCAFRVSRGKKKKKRILPPCLYARVLWRSHAVRKTETPPPPPLKPAADPALFSRNGKQAGRQITIF